MTYDDLAGVMTMRAIQCRAQRNPAIQARKACPGTPALFYLDALPKECKDEIYRRYPDAKAQAKAKPFIDTIVCDMAALDFYRNYQLADGRGLSFDKQGEYTNNASILNAFGEVLDRSDSEHKKNSKKCINRAKFWRMAAEMLPRIADRFPNSLPGNSRRLQEKYNQYRREGYEALVTKKIGNTNSAKMSNKEQIDVAIRIMADHRNLDNEQVAMLYNVMADKLGWPSVTRKNIEWCRRKHDLICAAGRLGAKEFYNNRAMQVKRAAPSFPLYMWSLDGWVAELFYQGSKNDTTTYYNRLTLEVVLDPCTKYPIGYAIGRDEDTALITAALKNAVDHTKELFGRRYRAHQVQSDNFAIKSMMPAYKAAGALVTPAKVGNAKSKPIERYFGTLNKNYANFFDNWSGFGVTSKKSLQPNSDAIEVLKRQFPDEDSCRRQMEFIINAERAKKRDEYVKLWESMPEEHRLLMSDEQYLLAFGEETGYKNTLEGSGLKIKLLGMRRTYDCFDTNFRKYGHVRWNVRYDRTDLTKVLAINEDGSLRFVLEEKYVQPMAKIEQTAEDRAQFSRISKHNKALEAEVKERIAEAQDTTDRLIKRHPELGNTLARILISDSKGQHKKHLQDQRRNIDNIDAVDVTVVNRNFSTVTQQAEDNLSDLY